LAGGVSPATFRGRSARECLGDRATVILENRGMAQEVHRWAGGRPRDRRDGRGPYFSLTVGHC